MEADSKKIQDLSFSLININSITDQKLLLLNPSLDKNHFQFFTELNIDDSHKLNIVTSCNVYDWVIIPKVDTNFAQRIGVRFCKSLSKFVKIEILDQQFYTQDRQQVDKSAVQLLSLKIQCYHVSFNCILVYRAPDCNAENRDKMFAYIDTVNPHIALGDINIDLSVKSNQKMLQDKLSLVNIIKKPTRVQTRKITHRVTKAVTFKTSSTRIDHVYTRKSWESRIKYTVKTVDPSISDHRLIVCNLSAKIPPVRLVIPQVLDPYRRYFPRNAIDWTSFICSFNFERYKNANYKQYYHALKESLINDCEHLDITFRKHLAPKKVFRFTMSEECREMKKNSIFAKFILKKSRQEYSESLDLLNQYKHSIHEAEMREQFSRCKLVLENNEFFYKFARNAYNHRVRRESQNSFKSQFARNKNNSAKLWEIANRSKGIVKKTVEDLSDPMYHPVAMAKFFQDRSKIGLIDDDPDEDYSILWENLDFNEMEMLSQEIFEVNVQISAIEIDKYMCWKPSASPDPDSLSMSIWNKFYFNNDEYCKAIRHLFIKCINFEHKLPGLEHHSVSLYLKKPIVLVQKDLRPVGSFESLPKRMLRYVVQTVKMEKPEVFYSKSEYSQPKAGCVALVMSAYESAQIVYFSPVAPPNTELGIPNKAHSKGHFISSFALYDKSNAYCTFKKDVAIRHLALKGNTRSILCHALISQQTFCVQNKIARSLPLRTTTGSAQGLTGSGEWYSSVSKRIKPPDISSVDSDATVKVFDFVDDNTHLVTTKAATHKTVLEKLDAQLQYDSLKFGLKNNAEKKIVIQIGADPPINERMLGIIINSSLTSHDEIGVCVAKLRKSANALRSTDCLSRNDRIDLAKLTTHARLGNWLFITTHSTPPKLEYFRKCVAQSFKKCAYLPITCPTENVENYIYGMSFIDYVNYRIVKFVETQNMREPAFLAKTCIRRNMFRVRRGETVGVLIKKYIAIKNGFTDHYFREIINLKQKNTLYHKKKCLDFKVNF